MLRLMGGVAWGWWGVAFTHVAMWMRGMLGLWEVSLAAAERMGPVSNGD